jgi:hypothetical protein
MTPATKSPSMTIAPFGGSWKALVTDVAKSVWRAPLVPPATLSTSEMMRDISVRASLTD